MPLCLAARSEAQGQSTCLMAQLQQATVRLLQLTTALQLQLLRGGGQWAAPKAAALPLRWERSLRLHRQKVKTPPPPLLRHTCCRPSTSLHPPGLGQLRLMQCRRLLQKARDHQHLGLASADQTLHRSRHFPLPAALPAATLAL